MKRKFLLTLILPISLLTYSQNLFVTKRDYSNPTYIHTLQKLNSTNGSVIENINYTSNFPGSYSPRSLSYNHSTNEIVGLSDTNIITKKNILNGNESTLTLPLESSIDYQGIVVFNNRLFVTKRDYSNSPTIHYILEVNLNNGNIISSQTLTSNIPTSYNRDLSFSNLTSEIFGMSGNIIYKYNIINNSETTLTLPIIASSDYTDMIIAENRLFVVKRDYSISPTIHTLLELDINNGSTINSHVYTTNLTDYDKIKSLTFLADTHEICGIIKDGSSPQNFKILKYNIFSNLENSFNLSSQSSIDYDEIVSTFNEETLSNSSFENIENLKIVKAYNLLGQEISTETSNQIIIIQFENGMTKKVYNQK
ncbi:hypothetical protein [Flavobacterium sp.]|uniref:hypothetical protein n=1 Tax=Flavobacterium sp. TaxID=239 RepID=UPI004048AA4A